MSSTAPALRARVPRLAGAALERARLTVVPKRTRRRTSPVPFLLVVSMLAVGGIVGLLLFNTSMQQASFAATDLQRQSDALQAQRQSLQMDLDQLRDPQSDRAQGPADGDGAARPARPSSTCAPGKVLGHPVPGHAARPAPAAGAAADQARRARPAGARDRRTRAGDPPATAGTRRATRRAGHTDNGHRAGRNDHTTSHEQHRPHP